MKKQLILLVVSAFVLGGTLSSSPAMAGHQPGFNLVIVPNIYFPVFEQRVIHRDHYSSVYFYNQYPTHHRPVKNMRVINHRPGHQITYIKHAEPVRVNKYRRAHDRSR